MKLNIFKGDFTLYYDNLNKNLLIVPFFRNMELSYYLKSILVDFVHYLNYRDIKYIKDASNELVYTPFNVSLSYLLEG